MHTQLRRCATLSVVVSVMVLLVGALTPLQADEIDLSNTLVQDEFNLLVRDLGTALSYTPVRTPEHSGLIGFRVGVGVTAAEIPDNRQYIQQAFENRDAPSLLYMPRIDAQKGLPLGLEVSGYVSGNPNGDARLFAGSLQYTLLEGGVTTPSVAVRAHGSQLFNVDELDLRTYGGDVSVSKGFTFVTPYAGYSLFNIEGEEDDPTINLATVDTDEDKIFGGARFSAGWLTLTAQADIGEEVNLYSLIGAFHF